MHFEQALSNFIAEIKEYYGDEPKIKSMEFSEDLYRRVEFELWGKALRSPPEKKVGSLCMQFYSHGDTISLYKETKQQPEKPKRTIAEVTSNANGQWIVRSNDGKLFIHGFDRSGVPQWLPYPDLPQD